MFPADAARDLWIEVGRYREYGEAEGHALALSAVGIGSRLVCADAGVALFVAASDAGEARRQLAEYDLENRRPPPAPALPLGDGVNAALVYAAVLVFTYVASIRRMFGLDWQSAGYAGSGEIAGGEWWRTLTALGLHADLGHLASNIVAGGAFGMLLSQLLGPGLAWLAIVLAACLANALNAFAHAPGHNAVGASTAVFAALGLLSALMWRRQSTRWARGLRRLLPLAAGAMLLAYMGFGGERTDVGAHVAGFAVGIVFGTGLHFISPRIPHRRGAQAVFGAAALAVFCAAWISAFRSA
jgi:membrane associated rhomboid family serine protease